MRYFDSNFNEHDGLPDDAQLLVRAVGSDNISQIERGLRKHGTPYFSAAEYKTDVSFYVPKDKHEEITKSVRAFTTAENYKEHL